MDAPINWRASQIDQEGRHFKKNFSFFNNSFLGVPDRATEIIESIGRTSDRIYWADHQFEFEVNRNKIPKICINTVRNLLKYVRLAIYSKHVLFVLELVAYDYRNDSEVSGKDLIKEIQQIAIKTNLKDLYIVKDDHVFKFLDIHKFLEVGNEMLGDVNVNVMEEIIQIRKKEIEQI